MKIVVVGLGYVGLANAILLAENNKVVAVDISSDRVQKLNDKLSPIEDLKISEYLEERSLDLQAVTSLSEAIVGSDFVIIATPTDYDDISNKFDTSSVESVIKSTIDLKPDTAIVIKSTVPIGFTDKMRSIFNKKNIFFSPEFLREGNALYDNLHPSRIVIGDNSASAKRFAEVMKDATLSKNAPILYTGTREAEAIKLFSNSYLSMRVMFFNELDSYALHQNLDARQIIEGVSLDKRIGNYYNNPSFGYGGYCLPKDTKQLLSNFKDIPQNMIGAIIESNNTRKKFISDFILSKSPKLVGVHRLTMKAESDNFRGSSILDVIAYLLKENIEIIIFEPLLDESEFMGTKVENDLTIFKEKADLILCNRFSEDLSDVENIVFTRDIFRID